MAIVAPAFHRGEYRAKPDNLGIAREDDWYDAFAAYALGRHLTASIA